MRLFAILGVLSLTWAGTSFAQTAPAAPSSKTEKASPETGYFEFLRGRHLEAQGQLAEALAAYERAAIADGASAQIRAEIAALYARQSRTEEAIREARRALELDSSNVEANWVLGALYASDLEARREAAGGAGERVDAGDGLPTVEMAITHLERARPGRPFDNGLLLTLGRLYLSRRAWTKAIGTLETTVEREPESAEARYLLAQAYDGSGELTRAVQTLEELLEIEPRFVRALLDIADLEVRRRDWPAAARAYERAAAAQPDNPDLKLRQAAALANGGQAREAREVLKAVERGRPAEPRVLMLLVDVERALHDYGAAERAARRLIELQPSQPMGAQALAQVFADRRQYREVVETLEAALGRVDGSTEHARLLASMRLTLGSAYLQLRQFDRALEAFDRAAKDGADEATVDAHRIQTHLDAGRPADALAVAQSARARHPDDLRLVGLEAAAWLKRGQPARAVEIHQAALERRGSEPEAHVAFASLLLEARDYARAETVLESAAQRFPTEIAIPFQLGAVLEEQRRYDEAERAFRRALALDAHHGPTLNYLGYMLADRGQRLDEAVQMLREAVDQDPYNGSYLDSLGWAYYKQGAFERAREYLVRAGEQLPTNSVVQDHLGDLHLALRNRAAAIAAWERALAGDGRSIEKREIQQKIDRARGRE
jgi:tetratricopeptide (TPR) repeat protein